jgi:hypothetical protein
MAIVYNVQMYPVYEGHINDHKVLTEREFTAYQDAIDYVEFFNSMGAHGVIAVYTGAIDTVSGENL